jgi:hypothetical protein
MMRAMMGEARREYWTLEEWAAFANRCLAVFDRIDGFSRSFERTRRLRATTVDALLQIHREMSHALTCVAGLAAVLHGEDGAAAVSCLLAREAVRAPLGGPPLTGRGFL